MGVSLADAAAHKLGRRNPRQDHRHEADRTSHSHHGADDEKYGKQVKEAQDKQLALLVDQQEATAMVERALKFRDEVTVFLDNLEE